MSRPSNKTKRMGKTKSDLQPWWEKLQDVVGDPWRVSIFTDATTGEVRTMAYERNDDEVKKYAYSLALSNAYEVDRELFGEPNDTDADMTECMTVRHEIAHDGRLITKEECDKYLAVIAGRFRSKNLIN